MRRWSGLKSFRVIEAVHTLYGRVFHMSLGRHWRIANKRSIDVCCDTDGMRKSAFCRAQVANFQLLCLKYLYWGLFFRVQNFIGSSINSFEWVDDMLILLMKIIYTDTIYAIAENWYIFFICDFFQLLFSTNFENNFWNQLITEQRLRPRFTSGTNILFKSDLVDY